MAAGPGQARPGAAHWLPSALPGPGPPGSSGRRLGLVAGNLPPPASLGWRLGVSPEDETTRVTPPRFSGPSPRHLPSRPTDFGAGVLRGAGRRHRRRIPRGCPPLPRSLAFPEALGGPAPLLLTFSSLQPTRVSRRLPLDFEHVCREERAWEGRALAFAALGRGPAVGPCRCPRGTDVASAKCRPSRRPRLLIRISPYGLDVQGSASQGRWESRGGRSAFALWA